MKYFLPIAAALGWLALFPGCGKKPSDSAPVAASPHQHHPPHDGTPVELGDETYHLELVLDQASGKLSVFVLDGEMENFIRVAAPSFEMVATVDGAKRPLLFTAVADSATGETIGDTALFEAKADWLKTTGKFDGVLTRLEVRGSLFSDVTFHFPQGNDKKE